MKTLVIYWSVSGFTRTYAEWIAEALSADLARRGEVDLDTMKQYDLIVYGGPLHAVGIAGLDLIKKNLDAIRAVKLIVFAVGASPPRDDLINELLTNNFSVDQRDRVKLFYLRGGFDFHKLTFPLRLVMRAMKWKIKTTPKEDRTDDDNGMLAAFEEPVDFRDRKNIEELVTFARALQRA